MKTIILGMGNTLLSDDGIGILIKRYLERKLKDTEQIDFVETSWGGFRIIDLLRGYDCAIIVDSIKTGYKPQGYIYHLKPADLLPSLRLTSYHDINFATALRLAETLEEKIPVNIDILAIEVVNNFTISEQLNPSLWKSISACSEIIIKLLESKKLLPENLNSVRFLNDVDAELINELYDEDLTAAEGKQKNEYSISLNFSN